MKSNHFKKYFVIVLFLDAEFPIIMKNGYVKNREGDSLFLEESSELAENYGKEPNPGDLQAHRVGCSPVQRCF